MGPSHVTRVLRCRVLQSQSKEEAAVALCSRLGVFGSTVTLPDFELQELLGALGAHMASERVQVGGMRALGKLGYNSATNCERIASDKGLARVYAAMDAFPTAVSVQSEASSALETLTRFGGPEVQARIRASGGVPRLQRAKDVVGSTRRKNYAALALDNITKSV